MIHTFVTADTIGTIPVEVREALGLKPGDLIGYEIEGRCAVLKKVNPHDPWENPFALFTEWADELDEEAFRNL
jgi:bifunctional DNA-binding transcriptional regulator/antitoxin component of YhaV-PrlF toxin-antitoxin module